MAVEEVVPPEPEHDSLFYYIRDGLGRIASGAIIVLPAVAAGGATALGIAEIPASVDTGIPGVAVDASIIQADYSSLTYGPKLIVPKIHKQELGRNFGVNIDVKQLNAPSDILLPGMTAIATDPKETLGKAAEDSLTRRVGEGEAGGTAVFELICLGGIMFIRRRRRGAAANELELSFHQSIDELPDETKAKIPTESLAINTAKLDKLNQERVNRPRRHLRNKIIAAASILAVSTTALGQEMEAVKPASAKSTVIASANSDNPLIRSLVHKAPLLEGASVTGIAGSGVKYGLEEIAYRKLAVDDIWINDRKRFSNEALPAFIKNGGMAWQADPNNLALMQVSDIHDSWPFLQHLLPSIIKKMGVGIVLNTGDEMNYSGKVLLDNGAWKRFADALPKGVPAIAIAGNHDIENLAPAYNLTFKTADGKTWHPIIPLDKTDNYKTVFDGITFVGSPDKNRTTGSGTIPASPDAQIANDAKQGHNLADVACAAKAKNQAEGDNAPIVLLAHEPSATYEAIARGCVALALNGHLHITYPVKAFINADGSITFHQTLGSSSGDGPNNTDVIYNGPTKQGAISVWIYNKQTHKFLDFEIEIFIDPNTGVSIEENTLPDASEAISPADDKDISQNLEKYNPTLLKDIASHEQAEAPRSTKQKQLGPIK